MDFLALLGGFAAFTFLLAAAWYVLQVVAYWRIFTKAGKPGWHSIIPFLNIYDQFDLSWRGLWGLVFLGLTLAVSLLTPNGVPADGMEPLVWVLSLTLLIIEIVGLYKLSKAFGHGVPFTLGLIFLSPFFMLYLGFGGDVYLGKQ